MRSGSLSSAVAAFAIMAGFAALPARAAPRVAKPVPAANVSVDVAPPPPVDLDELKDSLRVQSDLLREQVDDAKERDFMTKVKLTTFNEEVLRRIDPPGGARLIVVHRNQMAGAYLLVGLAYALDGNPAYAKLDQSGALDQRGQITVFDGKVLPGVHVLAVQYDLVGNPLGFFAYLKDIKLTLRRTYTFNIEAKRQTKLIGRLGTDNGMTALYEQRPNIGFETVVSNLAPEDKSDSAMAAQTAASLTGEKGLGSFAPAADEKKGDPPARETPATP